MAQANWVGCGDNLSTGVAPRGATAGAVPPNGGGDFVWGVNTFQATPGAVSLFLSQTNFTPAAKGFRVSAAIKRGNSGGPTNFSVGLFAGLQGTTNLDKGYILGLSDEDGSRITLAKGRLYDGVPAGAVGTSGILARGATAVPLNTWVHLQLDMIVNLNGDVVLRCSQNDLIAHDVSSPVWTEALPMFIDDALGVNSGSVPFINGRAGWTFASRDVARRAFVDHVVIARQL